jgi:hypothetical protein
MYLNGSGSAVSVQGNTIANFLYENNGYASWYGLYVAGGDANIGTVTGNTIGAATGTGSVTITCNWLNSYHYGIYVASTGVTDIRNNTIGYITMDGLNNYYNNVSFYGIFKTSGGGTTTISNNTIGSTTTANSIFGSSASTGVVAP